MADGGGTLARSRLPAESRRAWTGGNTLAANGGRRIASGLCGVTDRKGVDAICDRLVADGRCVVPLRIGIFAQRNRAHAGGRGEMTDGGGALSSGGLPTERAGARAGCNAFSADCGGGIAGSIGAVAHGQCVDAIGARTIAHGGRIFGSGRRIGAAGQAGCARGVRAGIGVARVQNTVIIGIQYTLILRLRRRCQGNGAGACRDQQRKASWSFCICHVMFPLPLFPAAAAWTTAVHQTDKTRKSFTITLILLEKWK